ncbi:ABC transporter permease, partial [Leucobacter chromiireducens subsp. solipictus]|nr:ABC transporter permease [Leucobacter chromiireducens subsp. solipictus]
PNDMKLVTAVLVVAALLLPRWGFLKKLPSLRDRNNKRQQDPAPDPVASATTGVTVPLDR